MAEKHIYLVRHGESEGNVTGVHRGEATVLTDRGHEQAQQVAERIAKVGVEALVASTYVRAQQTAEAISKKIGLPVETNADFGEQRFPSSFEGVQHDDPSVAAAGAAIFAGFADETYRHSDEENFADMKVRVLSALSFLENHPSDRICVVSHGHFLRTIVAAVLLGKDFSGRDAQRIFMSLVTSNTGITYLRSNSPAYFNPVLGIEMNPWRLKSWNDSAHLG